MSNDLSLCIHYSQDDQASQMHPDGLWEMPRDAEGDEHSQE